MKTAWQKYSQNLHGIGTNCCHGDHHHNPFRFQRLLREREIECLLYDRHQKGKMMIMILKTSGSQVDSPVAEGNRKEGGGRKRRDLHKDT